MSEIQLLRELVSFDSVFPNEERIGVFIEHLLKGHGFSTKRDYVERNRFNVLAERGRGRSSILFYGHMDTVPKYGTWKGGNPLRLREAGGKLYGLGAHDMKAGVAAALQAAIGSKGEYVKLLFCVDEENISKGSWSAGRKHRAWFDDVRVIVTGEAGVTHKNDGGTGVIMLGRRGRCVIAVEVKGRSAHGAEPERGINALSQAAIIASHTGMIPERRHKKLGKESIFVREIRSSSTSLSIPENAYLEFDMHIVPPDTSADARSRIEAYIKGLVSTRLLNPETRFNVYVAKRETPYLDPYITSETDRHVRKIMSLERKRSGRLHVNYGLSVADENVLANALHVPVVTLGPVGGGEHSSEEWVSKQSLTEIVGLYKEIIKNRI
ncbi:MAG: M20/M25/M40 family metallo-hydrolase [Candidatus Micrarchaeota archaeon]|nr:M20/M25/M40 family metallo-hydrolase [Candidatus Micrarchaeota archaeon]